MTGQEVKSSIIHPGIPLDISGIPSGVYILRAGDPGKKNLKNPPFEYPKHPIFIVLSELIPGHLACYFSTGTKISSCHLMGINPKCMRQGAVLSLPKMVVYQFPVWSWNTVPCPAWGTLTLAGV